MSNRETDTDSLSAEARRELFARLLREREGKPASHPVSFAQQRMWFIDCFGAEAAYNVPLALRLTGRLDVAALERSLTEILERHEILRATFTHSDGPPRQVIAASARLDLPVVDLSAVPVAERESQAWRLSTEETEKTFDLANGPVIRARLLRLGEMEHVFLVTMHHIVSDGWSVGVFSRELAAVYQAFSTGQPSPLPQLPIQYADFARWQRNSLRGEVLDRLLAYWKRQLVDLPVLELPKDRPRPREGSFRGAWESRLLPRTLTEGLKLLSRREGVTLFMTLLAVFQVLLQRYSGQDDIVVGTPIANRTRKEVEGLIGFFVNSLVMRGDAAGDPSFREYLGRVREMALEAYAHQDLPFEKLVEELDPERDPGRNPLVQVMFAVQNAPVQPFELAGIKIGPLEFPGLGAVPLGVPWRKTRFDLELHLWEQPEGLRAYLIYDTDLFDAATIRRMLGHYERLLEEVVKHPERRVCELPLLDEAERRQVVEEWNATGADYPAKATIHGLFEAQAARTPEAVALEYEGEELSYGELDARANQVARYLVRHGVGPETMVGLCVERGVEMVVATLGILKAGGAYVPLDPEYPASRLAFMLGDTAAPVLLTQAKLSGRLPECSGRVVCLDADWAEIAREERGAPEVKVGARNLAYVIYTSGSTGTPKGTCIEHRSVVRLVRNTNYVDMGPTDRIAQASVVSFDAATFEIWGALLNGARVVGVSRDVALSSREFAEFVRVRGITVMFLTTALFNQMAREAPGAFRTLRYVLFGGEAVDAGAVRAVLRDGPPQRLLHVYGPTEVTTFSSWHPVSELDEAASTVPIGRPIANTRLYVLDARMQPVPVGVPGELYAGGDGLAREYLHQPELTAEKFVPDPFDATPGARLYRTGDLVRWLPGGDIEFLGRIDQQVKLRGYRIELGEVEATLVQHPAVRQAVAMLREDEPGDKRLVAYVVAEDGAPADLGAQLRAHLLSTLPEYMVPTAFVTLDTLPLSPNGKVDRQALPEPERSAYQQAAYVAPRTPIEEILAGIWAEVLKLEQVGVHDNFFEMGGHSLLATQVMSRVRESFGREVPLRVLFSAPTVAGFAKALGAGGDDVGVSALALVPGDRASRVISKQGPDGGTEQVTAWPLSFAQQRLWFLHELQSESDAYHIPMAWRLRGPLDVAALEAALRGICLRHDALRTTFGVVKTDPVQFVSDMASVTMPVEDFHSQAGTESGDALRDRIAAICAAPFDLTRGPLLRTSLLRIDDEDHVLVIAIHHIVADGWSLGVFHRELTELYESHVSGRPSTLPCLPIQYADFALWQRAWLTGETLERQLSYWRERLRGHEHLELPTDRPRRAFQRLRGAQHQGMLPSALSRALVKLSISSGATLAMLIHAAFAALLHRYTGQDDIVVGVPIANRNRREIEGLIGFFVNSLAIRTYLTGDPTFTELLDRVRDAALAAYAHQDLPFEKLVEELQPERDPSRNPIFQVWCAVQNAQIGSMVLGDIRGEPMDTGLTPTRFDLELHLWNIEAGHCVTFMYNPDLFEAATIARFARHFERVLEAVVADPGVAVSSLAIQLEDERRLLEAWNDTAVDYPTDVTLHGQFEAQVERTPDAPALRFGEEHLTYAELDRRANALAKALRARGVGPDELVGVYMERSIEMVVALYGTLKAGGAYVPFEPGNPLHRLGRILQDARPRIVLTQADLAGELRAVLPGTEDGQSPEILVLDPEGRAVTQGTGTEGRAELDIGKRVTERGPVVDAGANDLAYVIFTSGSTGRPKGVMVPHKAVCNRLRWMQDEYPIGAGDRVLQKTPYAFDVSVWEFFWPLMVGAELVVAAPEGHKDPQYLVDVIREARITTMHFVPSMLQIFLSETDAVNLPLKRVFSSGEALSGELARAFLTRYPGTELHNLYGPTEAAVDVTYYACSIADERVNVPIGRPVANTRLYVLDHRMRPVPIGVFGELYLGGVQVARGYLGRPDLTAERFVADPWSEDPQARLYKTGDVVRFLPDGNVEYKGRSDFQVKIRGNRIECGEIEAALTDHDLVDQAIVMAREDEPGNSRLVGYVVLDARAREALIAGDGDESASSEHLGEWEQVYDDTYSMPGQVSTVSFVGWNSSYTGEPIPQAEMEEWIEGACSRLRAGPHERVLELGCGNGLVLFRMAPDCERYVGLDLSEVAVSGVRARAEASGLGNVTVLHARADDLTGVGDVSFDLVVLNSVVQYFPSVDYLAGVLDGALAKSGPGGRIFVGDVRSRPLLEAFYTSVAEHRTGPSASADEVREQVRRLAATERELIIHPDFFRAWAQGKPRVTAVEILPKAGRATNEMATFRYDVVLHVEAPVIASGKHTWTPWSPAWTRENMLRHLQDEKPQHLGLVGIPNGRTVGLVERSGRLRAGGIDRGVASESEGSIRPEALWEIAAQAGYAVDVRWTDAQQRVSALFRRADGRDEGVVAFPERPVIVRRWAEFANDPLLDAIHRNAIPRLREDLGQRLPDYMVPSAFVILDAFPLTPSGKLDRNALPAPDSGLRGLKTELVEPRNATEEQLVDIWRNLLRVDRVGIEDSFFDLGGHSLLATQLVSRVRAAFDVEIPLRTVFECRTIEQMALEILDRQAGVLDPEMLAQMVSTLEAGR